MIYVFALGFPTIAWLFILAAVEIARREFRQIPVGHRVLVFLLLVALLGLVNSVTNFLLVAPLLNVVH